MLIESGFIDPETYPWVCLQIVCGMYSNQTYGFAFPAGLWKVATRVPVGRSYLFTSIDCFAWYNISFKFFIQAFFCWLLIFLLYLLDEGSFILKLVLRCVRKLSVVRIKISHKYLIHPQVCGRSWQGWRFCYFTCCHQFIYWLQVNQPKFFLLIVGFY